MLPEKKKIEIRGAEFNCLVHEKGSPVWIVATHGLGEHLGRHSYLPKLFGDYFNIFQYDLRGHGLTDGKKAYIQDFREFVWDLEGVVDYLTEHYGMKRLILFGHSMGGLITAYYVQTVADKHLYPEKVFLSAPAVATPGFRGDFFRFAPLGLTKTLASIPFSIELGGLVDLKYLSHDQRVKEAYISDELNSLKVHSKLALELVNASRQVFSKPLRCKTALYAAIGTEDKVVNYPAFKSYFETHAKGAQVLTVKDSYHEIHNEIEKFRAPYFDFLKKSLLSSLFENI
ncbi:MAG: alpha/beta fold hydrolase [Bacteriovoracaceae bacterium]